uniref:ARAD1D02222p n=1 Tax=Blastobotrys adeninivorans TaxID=409370 RepID=A0A060T8B3_BLAAD
MAFFSTLQTLNPYHVLLYSIAYGTTTYQSFFVGLVAFRTLPLEQFSKLQSRIFPRYFPFQLLSAVALLASVPGDLVPLVWGTLGLCAATSLVNTAYLGPASAKLSVQRLEQAASEGKSHKDPTASDKLKKMNKRFGMMHGISVLINLAYWGALTVYGVHMVDVLTN